MEPERSKRSPGPERPKRAAVYARLDKAVAELRDRWGGRRARRSRARSGTTFGCTRHLGHEAHNSTALEGSTLVPREVGQLLRDGRAVGSRQLADYLEVQGYADAARRRMP